MGNEHSSDLWLPGRTLDHVYPPVDQEELSAEFARIIGGETTSVGDVLGTMRVPAPDETIHGIASIDLCEILRETARSMIRTSGNMDYYGNGYVDGMWEGFTENDPAHQDSVVRSIVQELMAKQHVTPTENHQDMAATIRNWRQHGVFVVANTSTLPGCELSTLRFLEAQYPDCFDGIVFPRNHDGKGKITKAEALRMTLAEAARYDIAPEFAIHIDDTKHHIEAMISAPPHHNMRFFMPRFESNAELDGHHQVVHADTPIEVFGEADIFVREQLQTAGHPNLYADRIRHVVNAALLRSVWLSQR